MNARAVDAQTVARLRTAVRNCTHLQGVELACSTGLTEDDVLEILESPSVRFVSVDGLPFADKRLRASPNRSKCVTTCGADEASLRFLQAYVAEATDFS